MLVLFLVVFSGGCRKDPIPDSAFERPGSTLDRSPGEVFLIDLLDELDAVTGAGGSSGVASAVKRRHVFPDGISGVFKKRVLSAVESDTTFIYGEVTPDGFGAVVTERHQYPKGILLITVRKTHGSSQGGIVSETRKYISFAGLRSDSAQQSNVTDVHALSGDTIVTHVLRNGTLDTYTFRLPVVTRVVDPRDGSVRVTSRFGSAGAVVTEVRDGAGALIQLRRNSGLADGSIVTYTQFADSTWRNVRSVGRSDGTVLREITTGP
jgi:hypothetical protein